MEVLFIVLLSMNYICVAIAQSQCKPLIQAGNPKVEGGLVNVECDISLDNNRCPDILNKLLWEKQYEDKSWKPVYEYSGSSKKYKAIDSGTGYSLANRSQGIESAHVHYLSIRPTIAADSGRWRCIVVETVRTNYSSPEGDIHVFTSLTKGDIEIVRNESTVLGKPEKYICRSTKPVYPEYSVVWQTGGTNYTLGTSKNSKEGFIWNIKNEIILTLTDYNDLGVTCYFVPPSMDVFESAMQGRKDSMANPAFPAKIKAFRHPDKERYGLKGTFKMTCVATGTNLTITWLINSKELIDTPDIVSTKIIKGSYEYGQTEALESTFTWRIARSDGRNKTIGDDVKQREGAFMCKALSGTTEDLSQSFHVKVNYRPIGLVIGTYKVKSKDIESGKEPGIFCPMHTSFNETIFWKTSKGPLHKELEDQQGNKDIKITNPQKYNCYEFNCNTTVEDDSVTYYDKFPVLILRDCDPSGGRLAGIVIPMIIGVVGIVVSEIFFLKMGKIDDCKSRLKLFGLGAGIAIGIIFAIIPVTHILLDVNLGNCITGHEVAGIVVSAFVGAILITVPIVVFARLYQGGKKPISKIQILAIVLAIIGVILAVAPIVGILHNVGLEGCMSGSEIIAAVLGSITGIVVITIIVIIVLKCKSGWSYTAAGKHDII